MASASTPKKSTHYEDSNTSFSHFRKTVCLQDWWLVKAEKDVDGRRLAIAGLTAREQQAIRVFSSAPICKRYDVFTLETVDGICVIIKGFINKVRTEENGFPSEVFDHFVFGFPPHWEEYAENCFGRGSRMDVASRSNVGLCKLSAHSGKEYGVMASAKGQHDLEDDTYKKSPFEVFKVCPSQVVPADDTSDLQNHVIDCVEDELNLDSGSGVATIKGTGGRDSLTSKDEGHPGFTACSLKHVHSMENDTSENLSLLINSGKDTVSSLKVDMVMQREPSCRSETKSSKKICISKGSGKLNKRTPILSKSNLNILNSHVSMDGAPVESLSPEGSHVDKTNPTKFNKVMSLEGTLCVSHKTPTKSSGSSERNKKDNKNDKLKNGSKSLFGAGASGKLHSVNSSTICTVGLKGAQNETLPTTTLVPEEPKFLVQSEKCVDYTMKHATVPPVLVENNATPSKMYMNVNATGSTERERNSELKSLGSGQKKSPVSTYSAEHKNRKRGSASEASEKLDAQKLNISSPVTAANHKCDMKVAVDKKGSDAKEARTSKKTKRKLTYETPTSLEQEERTSVASPESLCCKRSRSGRPLLPTLEFWRNQTVIYDADRRITGIQEGPCAVKLSRVSKSEPQRKRR